MAEIVEVISHSRNWVAPPGVTSVQVELWGAGGGGGGLNTNNTVCRGAGGAGGQYAIKSGIAVTPGNVYPIVVGSGGATQSGANGYAGGDTLFNTNVVVAKGGAGGQSYENGYQPGLGVTTGGVGDTVYAGGDGSAGGTGTTGGAGGGGAGSTGAGGDASANTAGVGTSELGGNGAAGLTTSGTGNSAYQITNFGGGGGGGANTTTALTTDRGGGAGRMGVVRITYYTALPGVIGVDVTGEYGGAYSTSDTLSLPYPVTLKQIDGGILAGDLLVVGVVNGNLDYAPTTPAGWTLLTNAQQTGGESPNTNGRTVTIFVKEATGSESGSLSISIPNATSTYGIMYLLRKPANGIWDLAACGGGDSIAGTGWSITAGSNPGIKTNDFLFILSGINKAGYTFSAQAITADDSVIQTLAEVRDFSDYLPQNIGMVIATGYVISGEATAAPVYVMTSSGTAALVPEGASVVLRIRVVNDPKVINENIYITDSIIKHAGIYRIITDSISIIESIITKVRRIFTESLSITVSIIKKGIKIFLVNTKLTVLNKGDIIRKTKKVFNEQFVITGLIIRISKRIFSEVITITESIRKSLPKIFTEDIKITPYFIRGIRKLINEVAVITQSFSRSFARVLSNTLTLTQIFTSRFIKIKVITEVARISEQTIRRLNGVITRWTKIIKDILGWAKSAKDINIWGKTGKDLGTWDKGAKDTGNWDKQNKDA